VYHYFTGKISKREEQIDFLSIILSICTMARKKLAFHSKPWYTDEKQNF
jgi:hypothetical protein